MTTQTPLAIEATGLVKSFGETRAVDGVDLAVRTGSVYGVLGPNGAGKTTTIRMLATLLRPDAGEARVLGHDIVTEDDAVRSVVSLTGQLASVDEDLTGRREPDPARAAARAAPARGEGARRRAPGSVRPRRRRRAPGQELLRRHAAPARHRREHRRDPAGDVPRRADHGARPPARGTRSGTSSGRWSPRAQRSCSAPSTSRRPTSSRTGSRSSTTAR